MDIRKHFITTDSPTKKLRTDEIFVEAHDSDPCSYMNHALDKPFLTIIPTVCSVVQFSNRKSKRDWLIPTRITDTSVGLTCKICSQVGSLTKCASTKEKISIASAWMSGVTAATSKKLHDKILQHEKSEAHKLCKRVKYSS